MLIKQLSNEPLSPAEKKALALALSINIFVMLMGAVANLLFLLWLLPGIFTMRINMVEMAALIQQYGARSVLPVCSRMVIYITLYPILWVLQVRVK